MLKNVEKNVGTAMTIHINLKNCTSTQIGFELEWDQGGNTLRRRNEAKRAQFLPVFGQLAVSQAYLNLINLVTSHGFIPSRVVEWDQQEHQGQTNFKDRAQSLRSIIIVAATIQRHTA